MATDKTFTCSTCGSQEHWLTEFPGSTCLACWTLQEYDKPMSTASQVTALWTSPKMIRRT